MEFSFSFFLILCYLPHLEIAFSIRNLRTENVALRYPHYAVILLGFFHDLFEDDFSIGTGTV
jgi:hypothetical protein